ncbi:hypothetical protein AQJ27_49090 [Streptomyces olivochromogenes]|uniref:Uncharacterized protein n=1 Tax=Streptomyces olivochromogenes TaxID=1963 RepID=A0A286PGY3_STROL|nr:hypothetical protein AQJ27_49090 [Streptomyces olivochromogenes]GAX58812.1 hypothetical protein SO3561_10387 [Streptomyces olivochromogenes]
MSHVILGGVPLHEGDDCVVCYVTAGQVREVAAALEPLDGQWLNHRFAVRTFAAYQGTGDAEDIAYTQAFRPGLRTFYRTAAPNGRAVVFTVDQQRREVPGAGTLAQVPPWRASLYVGMVTVRPDACPLIERFSPDFWAMSVVVLCCQSSARRLAFARSPAIWS